MNRRLLFKTIGALVVGAFLPPLRTAKAKLRRLINPSWRTGERYWEHLAYPEPTTASAISPDEEAVAHNVCRVLSPAKAPPVQLGWGGEGLDSVALRPIRDRIRYDRRMEVVANAERLREEVAEGGFQDWEARRAYFNSAVDTHWGPDAGRAIKGECSAFFTLPSDQITVAHLDDFEVALRKWRPGVPSRPPLL